MSGIKLSRISRFFLSSVEKGALKALEGQGCRIADNGDKW